MMYRETFDSCLDYKSYFIIKPYIFKDKFMCDDHLDNVCDRMMWQAACDRLEQWMLCLGQKGRTLTWKYFVISCPVKCLAKSSVIMYL